MSISSTLHCMACNVRVGHLSYSEVYTYDFDDGNRVSNIRQQVKKERFICKDCTPNAKEADEKAKILINLEKL